MRNWVKTLLFVSAFSPCLFSIAVVLLWERGLNMASAYYALFGALGLLSIRYIIDALRWKSESFPFRAKKIESNDVLMLGVVSTYFFPFIGRAASITLESVIAIAIVVVVVLWYSASILPSPAMRIMGYRFYKAESENGVVFTLVTQRELLDPKDVKRVKRISGSMLVEVLE